MPLHRLIWATHLRAIYTFNRESRRVPSTFTGFHLDAPLGLAVSCEAGVWVQARLEKEAGLGGIRPYWQHCGKAQWPAGQTAYETRFHGVPLWPGMGARCLTSVSRLNQRNRTRRRYVERDFLQEIGLHDCGVKLGRSEIRWSGQAGRKGSLAVGNGVQLPSTGRMFTSSSRKPQTLFKVLQLIRSGPPRLSEIIYLS